MLGAVAIALGETTAAHADDLALNFEMAAVQPSAEPAASAVPTVAPTELPLDVPLQVPASATKPPIQAASLANPELPPPPPNGVPGAIAPATLETVPQPAPMALAQNPPASEMPSAVASQSPSVELRFDAFANTVAQDANSRPPDSLMGKAVEGAARLLGLAPSTPKAASEGLEPLFQGGADSLVARVVGSAEGTRAADGQRTQAYYGHKDPGNGVWNLGSFSYQHGASSPEEADDRQLRRLQNQADLLQRKAASHGISLSLEELLNGIDLANQAPMAALDRGGYVDWLAKAKQEGMQGESAILWARTRAFIDPDTQQWNAPGLGNTADSISRDQDRRMKAIARAHDHYRAHTNPTGQIDEIDQLDQPVALNPPAPQPAASQPMGSDLPSLPSGASLGQAPPTEEPGILDQLFSINLPEFAF